MTQVQSAVIRNRNRLELCPMLEQEDHAMDQTKAAPRWGLGADKGLVALLVVYALLWLPIIGRSTANPQLLAAFSNDEPLITQQLVGMRLRPYGNPANLLADPSRRPAEWGHIAYPEIMY